jgi:hypothetical protein
MRKVMLTLLIAMLVTAALATAVSAGGNPPPALNSGFQLQNRSTTLAASVSIDFYDQTGANVKTVSDSIPANASKSYFVPSITGLPDSGRFSVVVSSTEDMFALVNEVTATGATPNLAATHSGLSSTEAGSPIYLPWVVCGYYNYNSMFAVQNAGNADANITVEFYQSGQSSVKKSYTFSNIKAGASVYLDMTQDPYKSDLTPTTSNGFYGAVKAYSTGNATPLVAALNDTNPAGSFLRSYNAVEGGATKLIAPQVTANYYGYSSGVTLQNPDPVNAASVTIGFYPAGSTTAVTTYTGTVQPGSALPIYLPSVAGMPTNFNGTAVIQSSIPVMGIANHDHVPAGPAASYNLIPESDAATTVYMPQIVRKYYNYESGYQLYNIGPEAVTVSVQFTKPDGSLVTTITNNIAAGAALTYYLGDSLGASLGTNFNGGAKATVTSGNGKLVGIANFTNTSLSGDVMQVYNLFH